MKRTLIIATLLLFTVSTATSVVRYDGPEDQPHIMGTGGSSASSSTAVGPNGTQYSSTVEMAGRDSNITDESVTSPVFSEVEGKTSVKFNGSIISPDLCHVIDQETEETGQDSYTLTVEAVKDDLDNNTLCGEAQTMIDYEAEFEAETPYNLTVLHGNNTMQTFTAEGPDITEPAEPVDRTGFMDTVINLFKGLF